MVAAVATVIITIFCIAQFYLKNSVLKSFATLIAALVALVSAFGFYEVLSTTLISRGYGAQWAQGGCFILLFAITFALTRILSEFLVGANIDFGEPAKYVTAVVCGILVGLIISGSLIVSLAMTPMGPNVPYVRFGDTLNISQPKSCILHIDKTVTGLFNWISKGALSSNKNFALYHPDFLDQLHLSKRKAKDGVITLAASDAITIEKDAINTRELSGGMIRTDIRIAFKGSSIKDGGARDEDNAIKFTLSQLRLVCVAKSATSADEGIRVIYPGDYKKPKENWISAANKKKIDLDKTITITSDDFDKAKKLGYVDVSFNVPDNLKPRLLQFKQSTVAKIPTAGKTETPVEEEQPATP